MCAGYMLLAGRVRKPEEAAVIQEVIEKHFKQCKVNPACLFSLSPHTSPTVLALLQAVVGQSSSPHLSAGVGGFEHVVWTQGMRRLAVLIGQAIQFGEPVLLVGDTGYDYLCLVYVCVLSAYTCISVYITSMFFFVVLALHPSNHI